MKEYCLNASGVTRSRVLGSHDRTDRCLSSDRASTDSKQPLSVGAHERVFVHRNSCSQNLENVESRVPKWHAHTQVSALLLYGARPFLRLQTASVL